MSASFAKPSEDAVIEIERVFNAPRALVFKMFTDPKHIAQFWGPKECTTVRCDVDLRVGGTFRVHMRGPDGTIYPCRGIYREIAVPERVVYEGDAEDDHACGGGIPPFSRVTLTFTERDGKTTLHIHTLLKSVAARDAAMAMGFGTSWQASLDRLTHYLAQQ